MQLQLKSQLIRSYKIKTKNQTVHRLGIKSPNRNSNFVKPKWVKLGTLLIIPETKLINILLLQQEDTNKIKSKNNRVASRKALSL